MAVAGVIGRSIPLVASTRSSSAASPGSARALLAVVLGVLSTATMPVAVAATRYSESYELVHAAFAIPVGLVLGALAVTSARQARRHDSASLGRAGGRRLAGAGRLFGLAGIWLAGAALVAVAVFGLLTYLGERD